MCRLLIQNIIYLQCPKCKAMIEEITFKNVLSFKDETTFSFEATSDDRLSDAHVRTMPNGTRLLRIGILYGANASGKSNLLAAIDALWNFWRSEPSNMDDTTAVVPFLLDAESPEMSSEYNVKFWINDIRYSYQLSVTRLRVLSEKLSYYRTNQPTMVFERTLENDRSVIRFNDSVQKLSAEEQKAITLNCLPNMSLFSACGKVNLRLEHIDTVRNWIRLGYMPMIEPRLDMTAFTKRKVNESEGFRNYILNFLNMADFNITALNDYLEDEFIPEQVQKLLLADDKVPEELRMAIKSKGTIKNHVLRFEHTVENARGQEKYELSMEQQSAGTKRLMGVEAAIFEVLKKDSFLMIDEMESSLHPELMEYIIQQFLLDQGNSQLLVTTHYDALLNTIDDLIRKDNIWFVEKNKAGVSELYSLVEFKGLNKIPHIDRAYRNGAFGALPVFKN